MLEAMAWKAALIVMVSHVASLALRKRSAAERHLVWVAAMAALLVLPLMDRAAPAVVVLDSAPVVAAMPVFTVDAAPAAAQHASEEAVDWAGRAWWLGIAAVLAFQLVGMMLLRWRERQTYSTPLLELLREEMGISRHVRLFVSRKARVPMTWGVLRPAIVLPEDADSWTAERMRVVLLHELAHVRRLDYLTQLAATVACAIYWYNPLVWMAAAAMRREREKACDDAVLRHGAKASDYAGHLLALASDGPISAAALPMAERSHLGSRIEAALNPKLSRRLPSSRARLTAALLAAMVVLTVVVVKTNAQGAGGNLHGSVLDISGAVVPNAEVRVILADGSRKRELTRSGPDGTYNFAGLPAGTYTVEARSAGFAMLTKPGVVVKPGDSLQANLTLEMGSVAETVEIVGKKPPFTAPARTGTPQRIRVGGNVQATRLIRQPKPDYPLHLQAQGVEGAVLLEGVISTEGNVISLRSLNTLVNAELIASAMEAVKEWRYQPTLLNGQPVEIVTTITMNYRLAP